MISTWSYLQTGSAQMVTLISSTLMDPRMFVLKMDVSVSNQATVQPGSNTVIRNLKPYWTPKFTVHKISYTKFPLSSSGSLFFRFYFESLSTLYYLTFWSAYWFLNEKGMSQPCSQIIVSIVPHILWLDRSKRFHFKVCTPPVQKRMQFLYSVTF